MQVWADIKKKHAAHALTADVSIGETAAAAQFMRADAVIVTGAATGAHPREDDMADVRRQCTLPLYVGSGMTADNLSQFFAHADGFIVGSAFKKSGHWHEAVDERRVDAFMSAHARCSSAHR